MKNFVPQILDNRARARRAHKFQLVIGAIDLTLA